MFGVVAWMHVRKYYSDSGRPGKTRVSACGSTGQKGPLGDGNSGGRDCSGDRDDGLVINPP